MKKPYTRSGIRFYLTWAALLLGQYSMGSIMAGAPFLLIGALLHLWAKGCLRQDQEVTQSGPYRYVRHPFYLAYLFIDIGIVVMAGSLPLAIVFPFWWFAIYIRTMRGEEAFLTRSFPDKYPNYRERVPLLFPYRKPLDKAGDGFSWYNSNIRDGNELPRFLHILAYPFLFVMAARFLDQGYTLFQSDIPGDITWLSALLFLYLCSWMTKRHLYYKKAIMIKPLRRPAILFVTAAAMLMGSALFFEWIEVKLDTSHMLLALTCMALSLPLAFMRSRSAVLVAETLAILGAISTTGHLWLALTVTALYIAYILDQRLEGNLSLGPNFNKLRVSPSQLWRTGAILAMSVVVVYADYQLW